MLYIRVQTLKTGKNRENTVDDFKKVIRNLQRQNGNFSLKTSLKNFGLRNFIRPPNSAPSLRLWIQCNINIYYYYTSCLATIGYFCIFLKQKMHAKNHN